MSDFQSRINSFSQGLKDQQSSYNSLAQTTSQFGRSVIPDKVAKHLQFVEQTGGMILGGSAGLHGLIGVGKKIAKYQKAKTAKNQPTGKPKDDQSNQQKAKTDSTDEQEAKSQTDSTDDPTNTGPTQSLKPSEAGEQGETGGEGGGKLQKSARRANQDDEEGGEGGEGGGGAAEGGGGAAAKTAASGGEEGGGAAAAPAKTVASGGEESGSAAGSGGASGSGAGGSAAAKGGSSAEDQVTQMEKGGQDSEWGDTFMGGENTTSSLGDTLTEGASRISGAVGDAATFVKEGAINIGKKIVGDAAMDVAADAVPIVGELFGLGMLIDGIVKAHKHEENAPPPKLTAATPEAQEQSGGFSSDMLKTASIAPTIS